MIKPILFLFFALSTLSSFSQTGNSWEKKASFAGLKREKAVAFTIGDLGYVSCGVDTAEITHNDLWSYDPSTDSWTQLASIPASERRNAIAFALNDKGYVGTGFSHDDAALGTKLNDFWEYNPLSNSWSEKANYPGGGDTGIYQATAFALFDRGYVVGGKIGSDAYIPEMWQYNPDSDSWIPRTGFPGGDRFQMIGFTLENHAIVGLGTDHDVMRKDLHIYDPITNTWEDLPDFPGTERTQSSSFGIGTNGYILFGSDGGLKDELWEYNYYTGSWIQRAPFPGGGRISAIAFSIGDKGYAGLGKEVSGKKQSFYEYTPAGPLGIAELNELIGSIYPNPVVDIATLQIPFSLIEGSIKIYSANGQLVMNEVLTDQTFTFVRGALKSGLYYLVIMNKEEEIVKAEKIILQ